MRITSAIILAGALLCAGAGQAADLEALTAGCEGCHGPDGISGNPDIPTIGGQSTDYLLKSLQFYHDWGRECVKSEFRYGDTTRPATDMCRLTENLDEDVLQALAEHYGKLPFVPAKQPFDPELAAAGAKLHADMCEVCHSQGGRVPGVGPRLAGQWLVYLKSALGFVPTAEHLVPPLMERKIVELNEQQIDELLNYYASQQGEQP